MDIRWGDKDSLLVLRPTLGVLRHRLEPGLPFDGQVLPAPHKGNAWEHLANDAGFVIASSIAVRLIWSPEALSKLFAGGAQVQMMGGGAGDIDIHDGRLAVLGLPGRDLERRRYDFKSTVWVGELEGGRFQSFEPWYRETLKKPTIKELRRITRHNNNGVGSLRFSPQGKLLVYLGYRPEVLLFSEDGEKKSSWSLEELVPGYRHDPKIATEYARLMDHRPSVEEYNAWVDAARVIVDDVLFVDGSPAIVVRRFEEGRATWELGLIEGERATWYGIPTGDIDSNSRLTADARQGGDVVFLGATRRVNILADSDQAARVLVARIP